MASPRSRKPKAAPKPVVELKEGQIAFEDIAPDMFVELVNSDDEIIAEGEVILITDESLTLDIDGEDTDFAWEDIAEVYELEVEDGEEEDEEDEEEGEEEDEEDEEEGEEEEAESSGSVTERHVGGSIGVSTVIVSRGKIVDGVKEQHDIEVDKFVTEPAYVKVSVSQSRQPAEYESVKVEVSITMPCYAEEVPEVLEEVSAMAAERLTTELAFHMGEE